MRSTPSFLRRTPPRKALLAALLALPGVGHAQFLERLSVHVEGGVGLPLAEPQATDYGLGFHGSLRPALRIAGPLNIHLLGAYWAWPTQDVARIESGSLTAIGGGVTISPTLSAGLGRLLLQPEAGYSGTGQEARSRFYAGVGAGWLFPLGAHLEVGLTVRYGLVLAADSDTLQVTDRGETRGTFHFASAGLTFGYRGWLLEEAPPPPPPDTDGDGVLDPQDQCVTIPAGPRPDASRPGCPVGDRDNDTVLDPEDQCPDQPRGDHPDPARAGCPAGDRDNDTLTDDVDRCPDEAEDRDNFEDTDGCPDLDNDHDGIPDLADQCRDQPETMNQHQDEDGCPDEAPPVAVVVENRISINQRVFFALDQATIEERSFPILDQVVTVLREHPELRAVRIEGHTDNAGTEDHNMDLSRDRARAVESYLRAHGIQRRRLSTEGFGATRPIAQGDSEEARAQNRRVDFIITEGAAAQGGGRHGRRHGGGSGGRRHRRGH
ncbi:MAG: OmpA family protein [Deltaproteobacteria bacterium]|nr:OmpA family protein [Deltaproteobacteria bacterium]